MSRANIALVGDYSERHAAHRAIPLALQLARGRSGADVGWEWVETRSVTSAPRDLARFSGVWLVPASPYASTDGALEAARWARQAGRPFLGTCGGFQHGVLEFARSVAGITGAGHEEMDPGGGELVLTRLACSLVEKSGTVRFVPGSLLAQAYGVASGIEGYRCNYGLNPAYRAALEAAGLRFTAFDEDGEVRGAELPSHPFHCGVLFQPERAALRGEVPPLVLAFVRAVAGGAGPGDS